MSFDDADFGATGDGAGTRFAVWSSAATSLDVCLFDEVGAEHRVALVRGSDPVWQTTVAGVGPGQRYGFRASTNPAKLLLDPYARRFAGDLVIHPALYREDPHTDSAPYLPRCVVVDPTYNWTGDTHPNTSWSDTIIYECHIRGMTMRHPDVPPELRGTYAGFALPVVTDYLRNLGVTAVELLPVQHYVSERALIKRGLVNYWGYNPIGWFAPHAGYAATQDPVREFRDLVRALHAAGIEVLLDVVFNHTAENGADGPTLSLRGLDNDAYYRMAGDGAYVDWTGCGNTVDFRSPIARRMVLDSLRYWVEEMHVDGFRFDLATVLARTDDGVDPQAPMLQEIAADPVVSSRKLIAEPWDLGPDGWRTGDFPPPWAEWNDRFRNTVRDLWRGAPVDPAELAQRMTGSADVFGDRPAWTSVNFVTAHDGFSLRDLVSYEHRHNDANGEANRDGTDDNRSWNCGIEGPSDDPEVATLRASQQRNILATLLLAAGTPMLRSGDEIGQTQGGNNNAYCQDNETAWLDWATADNDLFEFVCRLIALRRG